MDVNGRGRLARMTPTRLLTVFAAALAVAGCSASPAAPPAQSLRGQQLEVAAVWSGVEQQHFGLVLDAFTRRTGASVTYTPAGYSVPAFLAARLARGRPPDVAFLPQPGLLRQYAAEHLIVPLDGDTVSAVASNYSPAWRRLGSAGGRLYGVWFKAAEKSLIWYNEGVFEREGVAPPTDVDGLVRLAHRLARSGVPAFSVGGQDGWTLADWFSNLCLRLAGPVQYDRLAAHQIRWTDPSVIATLRLLARVLDPHVIAGGPRAAVLTSYPESVQQAFAIPPAAAMVFEGDFVSGIIRAVTPAVPGVDADVFPFPALGPPSPAVVAGGDAAVLMRRSAAGDALISYLASPQAAAIWAAAGGFVSPNVNVGLAVYPDAISRFIAASLLQAGDSFRFSLSDLTPADFGGMEGQGMRKSLQQFLVSRDAGVTAGQLEQAAGKAYPP
ncbi:MAG TPA: ABC transporter substrate-binding protein [Streptosporangiaceae bacterium]|nr:ABC transporter substrate-binding protein [Streptosporangiaceae bacterium]